LVVGGYLVSRRTPKSVDADISAEKPGPGAQPKASALTPISAAGTRADEEKRAGDERDDNALKLKLCWCPTGTMPGFWMGKYEVTQSEWARLMGSMPSHALDKGKGDRYPIYYVSHSDATEFCRKLTDLERNAGRLPSGWAYRLPTEAQWEYACRAGTTTATAFGDQLDSTQANFGGDWPYNGAPKGPDLKKTVEVGSYRPNAWGIYDMHGNVAELTATPVRSRGGSWRDSGRNCCSEIFISVAPNACADNLGFRVARAPREN
jgi:formylglycine-generating enzyme required for sulfatase activity